MISFRADLHCHSTCSDGSLTPNELVLLAKERGLQGISITDHDSFSAYPDVLNFAKEQGIKMITGAEFSTELKQKSVHVLGYNFDINNPRLQEICKRHKERRKNRNSQILNNLRKEGCTITEDELKAFTSASIGRPHIANLMIQKGFVKDIKEAFNRFLGDGKSCFARSTPLTIEETLYAIHEADGFAVLAHPHLYQSKKFVKEILEEGFDGQGFDGIECYYAHMRDEDNAPWIALAMEKELLMTGGSDFHGSNKSGISLGASFTNEETFKVLSGG